jgi:MOSC domain-containing protein YiiM
MNKLSLATSMVVVLGFTGQAFADQPHHGKQHKMVCHTEHHNVKSHGKWILKETKICK